jgi:hypothetical protein
MDLESLQLPGDSDTDLANEQLIESAYQMMLAAETPDAARAFFDAMCECVRKRSPQRIFLMEYTRRLTPRQ